MQSLDFRLKKISTQKLEIEWSEKQIVTRSLHQDHKTKILLIN